MKIIFFISYIARNGGGAAEPAEVTEPATCWDYTVAGLEPGAAYRFAFKALNEAGASEWSEPSEPIVTAPTIPEQVGAPTTAGEGAIADSSLALRWDEPHDNGSPIEHYTLLWSSNAHFRFPKTMDGIQKCTSKGI